MSTTRKATPAAAPVTTAPATGTLAVAAQEAGRVRLTPARPAETTGAAAAIASLLSIVLGVHDPQVIAAEIVVVGAIPAVVSTIVSAGGVRGLFRKVWGGA
jgi:hypothetical protein